MSAEELPIFVSDIVHSIAKDDGFVDYSVHVKSGSQTGDGLTSELTSIIINDDKSDKRLDLICKLMPANEFIRNEFCVNQIFKREALFYEKLMPIFSQFQEEKNVPKDDQFVSYPKCYATKIDEVTDQFLIILEDLRPCGFKLWDKTIPSPIENARLAMKELGKFHGLSIALKDQKPEVFAQFKEVKDIQKMRLLSTSMAEFLSSSMDQTIHSLENEDHKNIMRHIKSNFIAYLNDCLDDDTDRFGVLCHGDFWNNNTLFKFNEQGVAEEIRFLDFQITRYMSPATDILHNLFTSTEKSLRDEEYDNLIALYYESLSKTVKLLGSNPDELFSFNNLTDELKKCGNYALIIAPGVIGVSQADPSIFSMDNIDEKSWDENNKIELYFGLGEKGKMEYIRRVNEVFEDIIKLGYYYKIS